MEKLKKKHKSALNAMIGRSYVELCGYRYYVHGWHIDGLGDVRVDTSRGTFPLNAIGGRKKGLRRIPTKSILPQYRGGGKKRRLMRSVLQNLPKGHRLIKRWGGYAESRNRTRPVACSIGRQALGLRPLVCGVCI